MIEVNNGLGKGKVIRTMKKIEFGCLELSPKGTIDSHGHYDVRDRDKVIKHFEIWWTLSPKLLINGRYHFFYFCRNGKHWAKNRALSPKVMHYFKLWW